MSLDRLMVFVAVAKHRNVTRAAEELHITQPAVSKQLKLLQKEYSLELYHKADGGIELTRAGTIFMRGARAVLKEYKKFRESITAVSSVPKVDSLAVGGTYSPSLHLLPSLLAQFKRKHPHVQCTLRSQNKFAIERMIIRSEIEIGLVYAASKNPAIIAEPYRPEPLVAFVSRNHPLANSQRLTLGQLNSVPLIVRKAWTSSNSIERLLREMKKKGLNPNVALCCDSPEAVKEAVSRRLGVGILFKETIEPEVRKGEFRILKLPVKNLESQSLIVYRKDKPLSIPAKEFLEQLRRSRPRLVKDHVRKDTTPKNKLTR